MIAYATAPGKVAYDGDGKNSPYTAQLLRVMQTPGLEIEKVFKQVRIAVISETEGKQVPWESSSLTGEFYFTSNLIPQTQHFQHFSKLMIKLGFIDLQNVIDYIVKERQINPQQVNQPKVLKELLSEIGKDVIKYGEKYNYTIILEAGNILYAADNIEISDDIIRAETK